MHKIYDGTEINVRNGKKRCATEKFFISSRSLDCSVTEHKSKEIKIYF